MTGSRDAGSRRDFFRSAMGLSLVLLGAAGCSKNRVPISCGVGAGIAPEDLQVRVSLRYVEPADDTKRTCSSCQQYLTPAAGGGCGSCKVLKGPIHPNGTCKAFAPGSA
jgi:hypothetical protein